MRQRSGDHFDHRRDNRGNPQNLVPQFADIAHALRGAHLPQSREGLLDVAEDNGAPDDVISMLEELPDEEYHTMADVLHAAGEMRHSEERE